MNYVSIRDRPCRIMWSQRDPSVRKSGVGNIFIKNLDKSVDNKDLLDIFSPYGNILSCKVVSDENGSKGYGFVHYATQEEADRAITNVNNKVVKGKPLFVAPFVSRKERTENGEAEAKFNNVFVKNLPESYSVDQLRALFSPYGSITSVVIMKAEDKSKGFGFVCFDSVESARSAVEALNGHEIESKKIFVGRAQKKGERELELKAKFDAHKIERMNKYQGTNLYLKNIDDTIDEDRLRNEFSSYGTITSAKIMRDEKGKSKGFGFVCFSSSDEATKAVTDMNNKIIGNKPIYVALAQRAEERRVLLSNYFAQRATNIRLPNAMGLPGAPTYINPVYFQNMSAAQAQAAQARGFYPQQLIRGARFPPGAPSAVPVVGIPANFGAAPFNVAGNQTRGPRPPRGPRPQGHVLPGQPGQRGAPLQQFPGSPAAVPNANGPNVVRMPNNPNNPQIKYQANARNTQQAQQLQQIAPMGQGEAAEPFSSLLARSDPQRQKQLLGERLFPLIRQQQPEQAGKITGMLLEMDITELVHLTESPDALAAKVQEAIAVLKAHEDELKAAEGIATA